MTETIQALAAHARETFGDAIVGERIVHGELTLDVQRASLLKVCKRLRDDNLLRFEQLMDVCGVDYLTYRAEAPEGASDVQGRTSAARDTTSGAAPGPRFAAVYHLLSVSRNQRLCLRVALDDSLPMVDSLVDLWPSANWCEREAYDLFGIVFEGHPDLRRILTDYGFIGHPFRKDFPLSGHVEMRYDPVQRRVAYQPVSIDPRVLVPRVIREEGFGDRKP
ncbi:MAG TPA: NADH-quinone oxidoreductase subunit C [Acidiferrobacterales bacterium]|nr:NADH-quinone oxidoreductase subunit C [Acidiferrobacterales bacterium]